MAKHEFGIMEQKGIAYCGVTLIPPSSIPAFISVIKNIEITDENKAEISGLTALLRKAYSENKFVIHYGL